LAEITNQGIDKDIIWANFNSSVPIVNAELCFTTDSGDWFNRMWFNEQAELDTVDKKAYAKLPEGTTVAYLNLIDEKGLIVSTEHLNKF
jgi:hypothetical protein